MDFGNMDENIGRPPDRPLNFTLNYITNSFILNWDDNTESDFKEYEIYRSIRINNFSFENHKLIGTITGSYFIDNNLPSTNSMTSYNYSINAIDDEGLRSENNWVYHYFY